MWSELSSHVEQAAWLSGRALSLEMCRSPVRSRVAATRENFKISDAAAVALRCEMCSGCGLSSQIMMWRCNGAIGLSDLTGSPVAGSILSAHFHK